MPDFYEVSHTQQSARPLRNAVPVSVSFSFCSCWCLFAQSTDQQAGKIEKSEGKAMRRLARSVAAAAGGGGGGYLSGWSMAMAVSKHFSDAFSLIESSAFRQTCRLGLLLLLLLLSAPLSSQEEGCLLQLCSVFCWCSVEFQRSVRSLLVHRGMLLLLSAICSVGTTTTTTTGHYGPAVIQCCCCWPGLVHWLDYCNNFKQEKHCNNTDTMFSTSAHSQSVSICTRPQNCCWCSRLRLICTFSFHFYR